MKASTHCRGRSVGLSWAGLIWSGWPALQTGPRGERGDSLRVLGVVGRYQALDLTKEISERRSVQFPQPTCGKPLDPFSAQGSRAFELSGPLEQEHSDDCPRAYPPAHISQQRPECRLRLDPASDWLPTCWAEGMGMRSVRRGHRDSGDRSQRLSPYFPIELLSEETILTQDAILVPKHESISRKPGCI